MDGMTTSQRAAAAAETVTARQGSRTDLGRAGPHEVTTEEAAARWGVSIRSVKAARAVLHEDAGLFGRVKAGEVTVTAAYQSIRPGQKRTRSATSPAADIEQLTTTDEDIIARVHQVWEAEIEQLTTTDEDPDVAVQRARLVQMVLDLDEPWLDEAEGWLLHVGSTVKELDRLRASAHEEQDARRLEIIDQALTGHVRWPGRTGELLAKVVQKYAPDLDDRVHAGSLHLSVAYRSVFPRFVSDVVRTMDKEGLAHDEAVFRVACGDPEPEPPKRQKRTKSLRP